MTATPDRINKQRTLVAMVAMDTVDLLAERVRNLLAAGRRMTLVSRLTYMDELTYMHEPPKVTPGFTLGEVKYWHRAGSSAGVVVQLQPGANQTFGFFAHAGESDTEADVRQRYHATKDTHMGLRDLTEVRITGGLPGDGPARDDQIVIRQWNSAGVCIETVVAFDYDTGPAAEVPRQKRTWAELFPEGRVIYLEGTDSRAERFVQQIKDEFGFDPSKDQRWGQYVSYTEEDRYDDGPPGFTSYAFHCPAEHLDAIYASGRWPMGS